MDNTTQQRLPITRWLVCQLCNVILVAGIRRKNVSHLVHRFPKVEASFFRCRLE